MIRKTASELRVGDVFYRETYRKPDPRTDSRFTVQRLQRVPVHDFFGHLSERIEIKAENHITGPANLSLGVDEAVWLVDPSA